MNELPANLKVLGSNAFYGNSDHLIITKIPKNLERIEGWSFYFGDNIAISNFDNNLNYIGSYALAYAGSQIHFDTVYFGSNVTTIGKEAFGRFDGSGIYGSGKIKHLYFENPYTTYELSLVNDSNRATYEALSDAEKEAWLIYEMGWWKGIEDYAFSYDGSTI